MQVAKEVKVPSPRLPPKREKGVEEK